MNNLTKLVSKPINNIYVYTRVSTSKQSTDIKYGLSCQKDLCDKYINKFYSDKLNVYYFNDIGSSYKTQKILSDMKQMTYKLKQKSLILISEVSRLGRSFKMVESILKMVRKKKSFIVSVTDNLVYGKNQIMNKIFLQKVIESEKESDILSMRIKNTQAYIKRNGGYIGKAPFGYTIKKDFRNIPVLREKVEDFELIDKIVNFSNECCTYDEIKDKMNNNYLLHKNNLWTTKKIKEILNKFYPEHMLLNFNNDTNNKIVVTDDDIINEDNYINSECKMKLQDRFKNTKYENLKITIKNNERVVIYSPTSSIKLRSGREINKF